MSSAENPAPKSPTSHLHSMNLIVALLAGVISITGGIYSLKTNIFAGPSAGSLQGIVRDEKIAKPLKLAAVEISDLAGAVVNTATTDDDGHYLIESLKTGNYVVKFTAPLHKIETKTIKVEKDLTSSINVDLVPDVAQAVSLSVEPAASVRQNIQASYAPAASYQAVAPAVSVYNPPQNTATVATSPSTTYTQTIPVSDPSLSDPRPPGFRRHPRRSYSGELADNSSETSQSTSQGSALAETGAQLLQALLSKKSESSSSSTTTN